MINKLKASEKLYLLVFVMCIFIIGIGVYGIIEMKRMNQNTQTLYADRVLPIEQLTTVRYTYLSGIISQVEQIQTHHLLFKQAAKQLQQCQETISSNWRAYTQTYLTPEEIKLVKQIPVLIDKSFEIIEKLKTVLNNEDVHALDDIINNEFYPALNPVIVKINELINLQVKVAGELYKNSADVYNSSLKQFILLIILSLFFAIPFSFFLVRNVKDVVRHLRESERKYRNIFENVQDVFYQTSLTGVILDVSPSIKNHTGYTREELIGTNALNLFYYPEDREKGLRLLWEKGDLKDYEILFKSSAGEPVHISLNAVLIQDAAGNPIHQDGSFRNITERKKAEESLKQSEARLKEAQAIAHVGNWEIDMVNNTHVWSDESYKIFGVNKEEVQPSIETLLSFMHPDDVNRAQAEITEAFAILSSSSSNFRFVRGDSIRYAHIEWRFELDTNGHPIRLYGILQDITERQIAEKSIKQSEANYRQLFNLSPVPMLVVDDETSRFIQVNKACINNYGYSEEEFTGITTSNIMPVDEDKSARKNHPSKAFMYVKKHVKKSGELLDVETSSIPLILNGEKKVLVIAIDVTEKNMYEQKLTRAAIKAQEDERYEIGGELHDNVCQILATSMIFLGMMKKTLPPESSELYNHIHQYITMASDEIRNLSHRLAPAFFDNATLQDAFKQLLTTFNAEKKYEITLNFDNNSKNYPLSRDLQLNLYRILQEQLRNILKYAKANKVIIAVTINEDTLQMSIKDDGVGFDTTVGKGGIGLANMNRRAQLFSGNLSIHSKIGNGCSVIVEIPL